MPFPKKRYRLYSLWIAGLTAFSGSVFLLVWFLPGAIPSGNTSGVWAALAHDFANGVFYRPVFSEYGYGGTRYMPLFFVLHGKLIALFHDPVITGFALTLFSGLVLDIGIYALLLCLGVKSRVAFPCALLAHASISFQLITLEIRCDFLASALNIWGILFALRYEKRPSEIKLVFSALAFAGAFMTKFTTVAGLISIILYFLVRGQKGKATRLVIYTVVMTGSSLIWVHMASIGSAVESFKACATGGINLIYAMRSPLWFATATVQDPFFLIILIMALFLFFKSYRNLLSTFPYLYFIVTFITTIGIFASPGTDSNHLIDLLNGSILVMAVHFGRPGSYDKVFNGVFGTIAALILLSWLPWTPSIKAHISRVGRPTRNTVDYLNNHLGIRAKTVLSENPLLPILFGSHPMVMDCFSLRLVAAHSREIHADFEKKIETCFFQAIILLDWSGAPQDRLEYAMEHHSSLGVDRFYGEVHFPPGFWRLLKRNYYMSLVKRPYVIYEPRCFKKD